MYKLHGILPVRIAALPPLSNLNHPVCTFVPPEPLYYIPQYCCPKAFHNKHLCLPDKRATICRQCQWSGVPTITTSISLLSISPRRSLYRFFTRLPEIFSVSAAQFCNTFWSISARATHSTSGYARNALGFRTHSITTNQTNTDFITWNNAAPALIIKGLAVSPTPNREACFRKSLLEVIDLMNLRKTIVFCKEHKNRLTLYVAYSINFILF